MATSEQHALIKAVIDPLYSMGQADIGHVVDAVVEKTSWPSLRRRLLLAQHDAGIVSEAHAEEQRQAIADRTAKRSVSK